MKKHYSILLVTLLMALLLTCLSGCSLAKEIEAPQGTQEAPTESKSEEDDTATAQKTETGEEAGTTSDLGITGSGTEEDPWLVGAENREDVQVVIMDCFMNISGTGAMMDFPNAESCPWYGKTGEVDMLSIFEDVTYIGSYALSGVGKEDNSMLTYLPATLEGIGDSAFENAHISDFDVLNFPEGMTKIGARAFAGTALTEAVFQCHPQIAEDAFEGVTALLQTQGEGWTEADFADYGGTITWQKLLSLSLIEDYQTDEMSGESVMLLAEGEEYIHDAEGYLDEAGYHFDHYEVLEGDLQIEDPTDPVLPIVLTKDATILIVYAPDGE